MEDGIILEILGKNGEVQERHRLKEFPVEIGRAYTNAVILEDDSVCPVHLRVERRDSGTVMACDQNSLNGVFDAKTLQQIFEIELGAEAVVRVGETLLRFVPTTKKVPPSRKVRREISRFEQRISRPGRATAIVVAGMLFSIVCSHFFSNAAPRTSDNFGMMIVTSVIAFMLPAFASAAVWASVGSFSGRRARFFLHLGLASIVLSFVPLLSEVTAIAGVAMNSRIVSYVASIVLLAFPFFVFLSRSLQISAGVRREYRWVFSALMLAAAFSLSTTFVRVIRHQRPNQPHVAAAIIPASLQISGSETPEAFLKHVDALTEKLATAE